MKVLYEKEAEDFLEEQGFNVAKGKKFIDKDKALSYANELGFPVVLKVTKTLHKSDERGVILNVEKSEFFDAFEKLKKKSKEVLVQEQARGRYVILGLKKDPVFGHVLLFGLGGIFVEVLKDVALRICPVNANEVKKMIREIKAFPVLAGARGEKPVDLKTLENYLLKLCELAQKNPNIKELDINPLMITHKGAKIVDARIIFE